MYSLYSTRTGGWFTAKANYSSAHTEAKKFSRDEAIAFARRTRVGDGFNHIPVPDDILEEILK